MAKKTAKKKKPLLTLEEKKTICAARKILKRLSKEWKKLEDLVEDDWAVIVPAQDRFLEEVEPDHIDFLDDNAFIDLDN